MAQKVDDVISAVPGEWRFDADVARSFDAHVRKSVPFYDVIQDLVVELSEFFVRDGSGVYDIGASTGETLLRLARHHRGKADFRLIGIERSETMVEEAREKLRDWPGVRLLNQDVRETAFFERADLVLSLFTLQFLALEERFEVVERVFRELRAGGAFILAEKVFAESAQVEAIWQALHWDFKRRSGLDDAMILAKARSLRGVLLPMTVSENLHMLERAGFQKVDVFFKCANWVGLVAIKSEVGSRVSKEVYSAMALG